MGDAIKIEWTDATWNPVTGCSWVSPGCTNCYAMRLAGGRLKHHPSRAGLTDDSKAGPVWNGTVRLNEGWLDQPLRWRRPRRIFVCAHGDLFHENVPDDWIDRVFAVMALAPQHQFQVLTKRAERMQAYLGADDVQDRIEAFAFDWLDQSAGRDRAEDWMRMGRPGPLFNVWLGVSAEDQARADERVPALLATPAAVRFVSAEPLLGAIDLRHLEVVNGDYEVFPLTGTDECEYEDGSPAPDLPRLDWIIAGGESGPGARPMHPDWVRSLRDQCAAAEVPFFFKQWGEWLVGEPSVAAAADGNPYGLPLVFPDGHEFEVVSDGHDILLSAALDHRGAPVHLWRDYWASGDGRLVRRVGKAAAGARLDGREHRAMPVTGGPA